MIAQAHVLDDNKPNLERVVVQSLQEPPPKEQNQYTA